MKLTLSWLALGLISMADAWNNGTHAWNSTTAWEITTGNEYCGGHWKYNCQDGHPYHAPEPIIYWTLLEDQTIQSSGTYKISSSQSKSAMERMMEKTRTRNKVSVAANISASATIGAYKVAGEITAAYEGSFQDENARNLTTKTNVATTMSDEFEVPAGTYGMAVVEMKMLVYRTNATGDKLFRLTYPTGQMIVGGFNKNDFNTQILDDSFMSIARNFGVKTYSEDDIMQMAMNVPTLNTENIKKSSIKLIDYNESYQLFNTVFKGSLLSSTKATKYKKSTVTCVTDTNNYEWSFWQFERRGRGYVIKNAYHRNYILKGPTSSQPTSTKFTAAFTTGKISNSDIFSIINLGNNMIKIKSASGAYLNSFEPKQCSFSENIKYPAGMSSTGADIWLLRPKNLYFRLMGA